MSIIDYQNAIYRDTNVLDENVYFDNGQGCGTIWFKNVAKAKKFIAKYGRISGRDSGLCKKCQCHFSHGTKEWKEHEPWICRKWAEELKSKSL